MIGAPVTIVHRLTSHPHTSGGPLDWWSLALVSVAVVAVGAALVMQAERRGGR